MNKEKYERKINDVIIKCPIEAGVEILVYNVLDEIIDESKLSLVDINRIWKKKDSRLTTNSGIPDIAILSNNFEFGTENGCVYGFVEVKATSINLSLTEQIIGHKEVTPHYINTNGLTWVYYDNGILKWEINLSTKNKKFQTLSQEISICQTKYDELIRNLSDINWNEGNDTKDISK